MDEREIDRPTVAAGKRPPIRSEMTVRQVAADYPACRKVFLRYGEPEGRPTKFGHLEPLDRFARRHGVPLNVLLDELSRAAGVPVDYDSEAARRAHRPFVAAALLLTLSLGAGWGTLLLARISRQGTFTRVPAAHVVAHGEAQLWGFVALFVMGVAVSYLPVATARPRPGRWHARFMLSSILTGVLGGFAWSLAPQQWSWLGPLSGGALILGAVGYLFLAVRQLAGKWRTPWGRFIVASALWMVVWAVADFKLRTATSPRGPAVYSQGARLMLVELAVFGFALNAIYGFGQKLLPGLLRGGSTRPRMFDATWVLHNAGVSLLCLTHRADLTSMAGVGSITIAAGAVLYVAGLRGLFQRRRAPPRPEAGPDLLARYIQLAFFWLLVGLAMLAAGDLAGAVRSVSPPQAYLGATRHALTVGFMTTLILGVAQRLLPILGHNLLAWPRLVAPIFLLIAAGNALRVVTELATLAWPPAFRIMPFSAVLELSALCLFAANVVRTFWPPLDSLHRTGRVTARTHVANLLAEHPWLEDHLIVWGLRYIGRVRSVPAELTLGSLAAGEGFDPETTVARINVLLGGNTASEKKNETSR